MLLLIKTQKTMKKYKFNIEIELSEAQLKMLCESSGDTVHEYLQDYKALTSDKEPILLNKYEYGMGLASDINDFLSVGFLHLEGHGIETIPCKEDLCFHPMRHSFPKKLTTMEYKTLRQLDLKIGDIIEDDQGKRGVVWFVKKDSIKANYPDGNCRHYDMDIAKYKKITL